MEFEINSTLWSCQYHICFLSLVALNFNRILFSFIAHLVIVIFIAHLVIILRSMCNLAIWQYIKCRSDSKCHSSDVFGIQEHEHDEFTKCIKMQNGAFAYHWRLGEGYSRLQFGISQWQHRLRKWLPFTMGWPCEASFGHLRACSLHGFWVICHI